MVEILKNGFVINGSYVEKLHDPEHNFKVGDKVQIIDTLPEG